MNQEDNVEFVTRIMEFCPTGAMSQLFIIEAIRRYAEQCVATRLPEGTLISAYAWQETAQYIKAELDKKYGG